MEKREFIETVVPQQLSDVMELFGAYDENLQEICRLTKTSIRQKDDQIEIRGEQRNVEQARRVVEKLLDQISRQLPVDISSIRYAFAEQENTEPAEYGVIAVTSRGKKVRPKTRGQKAYVDAIRKNTVVFAVGPAGTGKTYLAMAMAVIALKKKEIERIVLTRPAVEAGEKLGFLPGDLQEKVDPYLRPLYDALYDFMGAENARKMMERGAIEVAPLAYMRGRTLSDSYIVLDEAQNASISQMKMFLTRFGEGSKVIVTGDLTQTDLPPDKKSGLAHAVKILSDIEGIKTIRLNEKDVVRHHLVQDIIKAYETKGERKGS